jgi:hypothetical protein
MIQPANIAYKGVVGGTFDGQITLFSGSLQYVWYGVWQPFRTYPINAMVAGSDANVYVSLREIAADDNPVTDSVNWAPLAKIDLTGWTGVATINKTISVPCTMGGATGLVSFNFSGGVTGTLAAGTYDFNIEVITSTSANYFPVIGTLNLISP